MDLLASKIPLTVIQVFRKSRLSKKTLTYLSFDRGNHLRKQIYFYLKKENLSFENFLLSTEIFFVFILLYNY